jgi:hypothetical protein
MQSVALPIGWYWLGEWSIDHTFPSLDSNGWASCIDTGGAFSTLFSANKRRRRWVRVRRKRVDYLRSLDDGDYLKKAERMYRESFPGGDILTRMRSVDQNFALCQKIIEALLNGIKGMGFRDWSNNLDDLDENRKARAVRLVEKLLSDGEVLKSSIGAQSTNDHDSSDDVRSSLPQQPPFDSLSSLTDITSRIPTTQSRVMETHRWQQDEESSECPLWHVPVPLNVPSTQSFSLFRRRHHCRLCGRLCCHPCSSNCMYAAGSDDPVRVCNECFENESILSPGIGMGRSMHECPVCGLDLSGIDSEAHLVTCLVEESGRTSRIMPGSRYVVFTLVKEEGTVGGGECLICFEEFENGQRVARMNCLCVFHAVCVEDWFGVQRERLGAGVSCPTHTG